MTFAAPTAVISARSPLEVAMSFKFLVAGTLASLVLAAGAVTHAQDAPRPDQLVDALNGVFGNNPGMRAAHTKGICLTGTFTPAADAASLSKAGHFAKPVPVTARFSLGGGNPQSADNAQDNVRGLAIRFDLGDGAFTDLVMISAPVFFVKTPTLFVELLQTLKSGDKDKLKAFFEAHPESTRQNAWLTSHPVPASYAGVGYWGVHGFTFTNAAGETKLVKYKAVPGAGDLGLSPEEATAKGPDFYDAELKDRLAKGPASFELEAILGKDGDQTSDPTTRWDDEDNRDKAALGTIEIAAIPPDSTCNAFSFLPANVTDGIAGPSDDPVFAARSPAYVVSQIRRSAPAPQ
jgi:catalase